MPDGPSAITLPKTEEPPAAFRPTAQHNVQRQAVDLDTCAAGYGAILAEIEPGQNGTDLRRYCS